MGALVRIRTGLDLPELQGRNTLDMTFFNLFHIYTFMSVQLPRYPIALMRFPFGKVYRALYLPSTNTLFTFLKM